VPGLDVATDLGLLTALATHVVSAYGLRPEQLEYWSRRALAAGAMQAIKQIGKPFAEYMTRECVLLLLRRLGVRVAVKSVAKWVPFVGAAVSSLLGYQLTYSFGEYLIDQCEEAARRILGVVEAGEPCVA
jgi:hypothetical protein